MRYPEVKEARFLSRPNRFLARVRCNGEELTVHVKNTGRCEELFVPGAQVWISRAQNPGRKTAFDLVTVEREDGMLVNVDSQIPNALVREFLGKEKPQKLMPEYRFGESRLDFYMKKDGKETLIEVKGCTLERGGTGLFPDAPTQRGTRHIRELIRAKREGYEAQIWFVIQMNGVTRVEANQAQDPGFAQALDEAEKAGVRIRMLPCCVAYDGIRLYSTQF